MVPKEKKEKVTSPKPKADAKASTKKEAPADVQLQPNPTLEAILGQLWAARQMKATAEKMEKDAKSQVSEMIDQVADQFPDAALIAGGWKIRRTPGANVRIDAPTLLEKGVAPEIVEAATVRTSYYQYRLTQVQVEAEGEASDGGQ